MCKTKSAYKIEPNTGGVREPPQKKKREKNEASTGRVRENPLI